MASTAELKKRLAEIDAALALGAETVEADGVKTTINLSQLRIERERIERQIPSLSKRRKGTAYRVTGLGN